MDKVKLIAELQELRSKFEAAVKKAEEEQQILQGMVSSLCTRIAIQSELLGRSAEARGATYERVKELEDALAPFAALLANGWDQASGLPSDAVYPVSLADLRRAAKVLAGTNYQAGNKAA